MGQAANRITIRGKTLDMETLLDPCIHDQSVRKRLREKFHHAYPFPHLQLDSLFNPELLYLVREEFDLNTARGWRVFTGPHEKTFRSPAGTRLGPASRIYFDLVNSHEFVEFLAEVSGVQHLIVDRTLLGGGLHESRDGGKFGVHRDFDRHAETGLNNEMVFLTYLNPDWKPEWGGALELWDAQAQEAVVRIQPELGISLLMKNQHDSYHGHPEPMHLPEGVKRRSLASYYYTNPHRHEHRAAARTTSFLQHSKRFILRHQALRIARLWSPPVLWDFARRLRRRAFA